MRQAIRKGAPGARETISYNMPAFSVDGKPIVLFAAFKSHIGFYPGVAAIAAFKDELSSYKSAKGSVQFPVEDPLPLSLVTRIVRFRATRS